MEVRQDEPEEGHPCLRHSPGCKGRVAQTPHDRGDEAEACEDSFPAMVLTEDVGQGKGREVLDGDGEGSDEVPDGGYGEGVPEDGRLRPTCR